MRLEWGDPGCSVAIVLLDGIPCTLVTAADEAEGWVDCLCRDQQGRFPHDGPRRRTERLRGSVTIVVPEKSGWMREGDVIRRRGVNGSV